MHALGQAFRLHLEWHTLYFFALNLGFLFCGKFSQDAGFTSIAISFFAAKKATFMTKNDILGHLGAHLTILRCRKCFRRGDIPLKKIEFFYPPPPIWAPPNLGDTMVNILYLLCNLEAWWSNSSTWIPLYDIFSDFADVLLLHHPRRNS